MSCSQLGPAATVNVPAYNPQPGRAAITLVRYSIITSGKMLLVGLLLEGDFEPPPQVPPLTIQPGQVLKATATVKNIGGSRDTFFVRAYLDIAAADLPHTFYMDAQQYGSYTCTDYWLYDHMIQICFTEARVTLDPATEVNIDFISKPLPVINGLVGVAWEAGRFVNGKYVSTDHWFRDETSIKYQR